MSLLVHDCRSLSSSVNSLSSFLFSRIYRCKDEIRNDAHRAEREETKMKNEMNELNMKELDLNELEQVNGGDFLIGAAIICGLIYYGTVMAVAYSKK